VARADAVALVAFGIEGDTDLLAGTNLDRGLRELSAVRGLPRFSSRMCDRGVRG
jgi:hypothetical protein